MTDADDGLWIPPDPFEAACRRDPAFRARSEAMASELDRLIAESEAVLAAAKARETPAAHEPPPDPPRREAKLAYCRCRPSSVRRRRR